MTGVVMAGVLKNALADRGGGIASTTPERASLAATTMYR
jgi:hypothetical protein